MGFSGSKESEDKNKDGWAKALGVAFNVYEFLSSHSALVAGAAASDVVGIKRSDKNSDDVTAEKKADNGFINKETLELVSLSLVIVSLC